MRSRKIPNRHLLLRVIGELDALAIALGSVPALRGVASYLDAAVNASEAKEGPKPLLARGRRR